MLEDLLPVNHDVSIYRAEPFVMAADIYTNPQMYGQAGWTWYTGAAAWYAIARRLI
jgi:cyclic beta-1,2-glucan synthetase